MPDETEWKRITSAVPCRHCRAVGEIEYRDWESSDGAHEDTHYRCRVCGKDWWIEGSDY